MTSELIEQMKRECSGLSAVGSPWAIDAMLVMRKAITALESLPVWRSKDDPPSDNRDVVVCDMNCTNDYAYPYKPADSRCLGFYENGKWYHGMDSDKMEMEGITHWIDVGLPQITG
jgi:hypothetical protein